MVIRLRLLNNFACFQLVPRLRPWNASDEALPRVREAEPQAGIPSVDAGNEC